MSVSVALLGWDEEPIRVVQDVEWTLDDRADSTNQLRVTTSLAEADGVKAEQEIIFKGRRFRVSDIDRDRDADTAVIVADEAQAALADIVLTDFRPSNRSLTGAMSDILSGTRWTIGEAVGARDGNANFDEITALDALQFLARHQDAQLGFDSLRRRVNITPSKGTEYEYVFTYGRQLSNIQKSEIAPQTTVIYPTMADTDEEVALDPVEDYGYYFAQGLSLAEARARFRKEDHWAERDYEFAENMVRDAQKRLAEEAYPQITYTLTAQATVSVDGVDDFDLAELHLGDQVYVWDQEIDAKLRAEVSAVTTSSDQSENVLTLSALPASLGASVEGRYFGDSGRPSSGGPRRSGPQPRPSMPILEQMGDYGIAVTRWNGQDHDGNYHTIPQRFGTLLTLVAPLEDGVIPSPMDSSHTFMGSDINKRGGGTSTIGFNGYGEFAIWHQMRGWDGITKSQLSEPLVVDVPPAFDPEPLQADLKDARNRLSAAETNAQEAFDEVGQLREEWQTDFPALQQELDDAKDAVAAAETRLAAAETSITESAGNIQAVQGQVTHLNDEQLPALTGRLDNIEPLFDDYDDRIQSAQDGAQSARDTAENLRDNVLPPLQGEIVDLTENRLPAVEGTLDQTRLGMENLRDVRIPDLDEELRAGIQEVDHRVSSLAITDSDNLWADPGVFLYGELDDGLWSNSRDNFQINSSTIAGSRSRYWIGAAPNNDLAFTTSRNASATDPGWVQHEPGQHYRVEYKYRVLGNRDGIGATAQLGMMLFEWTESPGQATPGGFVAGQAFRRHEADNSEGGTLALNYIHTGSTVITNVPDNAGRVRFRFSTRASNDVPDDALIQFTDINVYRMNAGKLIVDGSISARHIMAESIAAAVGEFLHISADNIDTENLAAYLATIIELDAGQITAGKINTARLDAQEVAGAVANFLTLDALEINFEQLAGEIANIIELTAENLAAGSIQARHLAVGSFENLVSDPEFKGLPDASAELEHPWSLVSGATGSWRHSANSSGRGVARSSQSWRDDAVGARLEHGPGDPETGAGGVPVKGGDQFFVSVDTWRSSAASGLFRLVARFRTASGNLDSFEVVATSDSPGSQTLSGSFTVPTSSDALYMRLDFDIRPGMAGSIEVSNPFMRRLVGGELLVDGGIYARHLNVEEIFFDEAVGNTVAAGVAEFLELHAEQITSGQIDTDLLNVNDLAARVATVIRLNADRITAGELGAERINVASFFAEDAFVNNLRSAVVTALEVTAERGFIGGALLEDDSITVAKLTATDQIAAELGEFITLNADQIRSNSWTGIVATGATFQTHAQANRGVKMLPGGLRGWDSSGNLNFDLSSSTGNLLATGVFRTSRGGDRAELDPGTFGGRLSFHRGSHIGSLKLNDSPDRLEMVYSGTSIPAQELPNVGVEETRAMMGYRGQRLIFGGTTSANQHMRLEVQDGPAEVYGTLTMASNSRMRFDRNTWSIGYIGQRPEASSSLFEIRGDGTPLRLSGQRIDSPAIYNNSTTLDSNVQITSSGTLRRSSSASKYKVDSRDLTVPDSLLDIPVREWIDKAELEKWGDLEGEPRPFAEEDQEAYDSITLKRIPGVIAEEVESHGGDQFVAYGPDGELEQVRYDRLALAQIQVLKRKHDALEQRVRELEGAA